MINEQIHEQIVFALESEEFDGGFIFPPIFQKITEPLISSEIRLALEREIYDL